MTRDLLIVGASARAAAASAIRAGYRPWCVDLFADRDLAAASVKRCPMYRYPEAIPEIIASWSELPREAPALFTGAMENHLDVVEAIARSRSLLGSSVNAMRAAREPSLWRHICLPFPLGEGRGEGFVASSIIAPDILDTGISVPTKNRWLLKPLRSAGGRHIRNARAGEPIPPGHYAQRFVEGTSIGAVFVATPHGTILAGASRQLIGEQAFGARDFAYCGSIGPMTLTPTQHRSLESLGRAAATACDLRGVFGIDLILDDEGLLHPIELNPRYTASVEILEAASPGLRVLAPEFAGPTLVAPPAGRVFGKAIVYARKDGVAPDMYEHFEPWEIADVPAPGEPIAARHPVCSVCASENNDAACERELRDMAERLYSHLP